MITIPIRYNWYILLQVIGHKLCLREWFFFKNTSTFLAKVQFLRNKMKKMLFCTIFHWPYQLPVFWSVLAPIWINTLFGTKKIIKNNFIFLAKVQFLRNKMKKMLFLNYFLLIIPITGIWLVLTPIWIKTVFRTKKIIKNNFIFFTWSSI